MNYPAFLAKTPEPRLRSKRYNNRKLQVWEGRVKVEDIQGWADNPRMQLSKKSYQQAVGTRDLTQDEIFDLMKQDPDAELRVLRDDIIKNGLKEPITLSFTGKLLDGNRRFFALKYALESIPVTDPNRQDFETVDAYVLMENATDEDEQCVLVEENFAPSLKKEWPDYVKAQHVIEADEEGATVAEIAKKFNWTPQKVRETLKINEIIHDFMIFATLAPDPSDDLGGGLGLSHLEAETLASKHYQFFNEAQKSFFDAVRTDMEFKANFFRWIKEEKFSSFPEVRIAHKAWMDPEVKAIITRNDPGAAKDAKSTLDYNSRIVKSGEEVSGRIDTFVKFLRDLKPDQIKSLTPDSRKKLTEAIELIRNMSEAVASK